MGTLFGDHSRPPRQSYKGLDTPASRRRKTSRASDLMWFGDLAVPGMFIGWMRDGGLGVHGYSGGGWRPGPDFTWRLCRRGKCTNGTEPATASDKRSIVVRMQTRDREEDVLEFSAPEKICVRHSGISDTRLQDRSAIWISGPPLSHAPPGLRRKRSTIRQATYRKCSGQCLGVIQTR